MNEQAAHAMLMGFACVFVPYAIAWLYLRWKREAWMHEQREEARRREAAMHKREHEAWMRYFQREWTELRRINAARRRKHEAWYRSQRERDAKRKRGAS